MNFIEYLNKILKNYIKKAELINGNYVITVNKNDFMFIISFLKLHAHTQFSQLMEHTIIDYPTEKNRFVLIYSLLSPLYNSRILIKYTINELDNVNSLTCLYKTANWWERENWDMFGIYYKNHPDFRRILTDYGFQGHPLRKDFPLTGFFNTEYNYSQKRVINSPISLNMEMRLFNYKTPWK
jgi:NADH/F420H2 dehydrogenase subunit C